MKALVIGLGMGQQYRTWLDELGFEVLTLDTDPKRTANFTTINEAVDNYNYDIVYIGTPNNTHLELARAVVNKTRILLIEKPGFETADEWDKFVKTYPGTRVMMVKNNQYRKEFDQFTHSMSSAKRIDVCWIRSNGIPQSPWFCNQKLSYGGVSRDLMPHLLSYFTALGDFKNSQIIFKQSKDNHNKGIDTEAYLEVMVKHTIWRFHADWSNQRYDNHSITFRSNSHCDQYDLGALCPAEPYKSMIETAIKNISNDVFWQKQLKQDLWIHNTVEKLCSSVV